MRMRQVSGRKNDDDEGGDNQDYQSDEEDKDVQELQEDDAGYQSGTLNYN